jgi:hypothetical protein
MTITLTARTGDTCPITLNKTGRCAIAVSVVGTRLVDRMSQIVTRYRCQRGLVLLLLLVVFFLPFSFENIMSKTNSVLEHLKKRPITSWEAITAYKATRLADIIFRLRCRGFNISTELVDGGKTKYARYRLSK